MPTLKARYESVRRDFEIADIGFFLLRIIALAGTVGWLLVAPVPRETVSTFLRIAGFFLAYCLLVYTLLFFRFDRKEGHLPALSPVRLCLRLPPDRTLRRVCQQLLHRILPAHRPACLLLRLSQRHDRGRSVHRDLSPRRSSHLCNRTDRLSAPHFLPFPHRAPDRPALGDPSARTTRRSSRSTRT